MTWNCWCLNSRYGFSPKRPSAGRREGWTYATFQGSCPSTRRNVSGCIVPAPISMSSGWCSRQPREDQNSESLKMSCCSVTIINRGASPRRTPQRRRSRGPRAPLRSGVARRRRASNLTGGLRPAEPPSAVARGGPPPRFRLRQGYGGRAEAPSARRRASILPAVPHFTENPYRLQLFLEVQVQQPPVHRFELPRSAIAQTKRLQPVRRHPACGGQKMHG